MSSPAQLNGDIVQKRYLAEIYSNACLSPKAQLP